jgi:hypothetical protein
MPQHFRAENPRPEREPFTDSAYAHADCRQRYRHALHNVDELY